MHLRLAVLLLSSSALHAQSVPRVREQTSPTTALLQAIHAVNDSVVWASGHRGTVLRTRDGGITWERLAAPAGDTLEFRDVHALSANEAWILSSGNGPKSRIYHTTDGGRRWSRQFLNADSAAFFDCLSMRASSAGAVFGVAFGDASQGRSNILHTRDGGAHWTPAEGAPAPRPSEGGFAASGQCVVHGDAQTVFIATGAPEARLFRSTDGGARWQALTTPFVRGTVAGMTGLSFDGPRRGIAVAGDIDRLRTDTSSAVVGITEDGGTTWTLRARPPLPGALSGVTWVPAVSRGAIVASGYGGAFYSLDGALTWTTLTDAVTPSVTAAGRRVWISGAKGRIWRLDF